MTCKRSSREVNTEDYVGNQRIVKRIRLTAPLPEEQLCVSLELAPTATSSTASPSPRNSFSSASSYRTNMSEISTAEGTNKMSRASSIHSSDSDETKKRKKRLTIGGPRKPTMQLQIMLEEMKTMRSKLDALIPQLAKSNNDLSSEHNMERDASDDEEGQHIDMEIACGVLEEQSAADHTPLSDTDIKLPSFRTHRPDIVDLSKGSSTRLESDHASDADDDDDTSSSSDSEADSIETKDYNHGSEPQQYLQGGHADEPCIMRTLIRHQSGDGAFRPSNKELVELEAEDRKARSVASLSEMSEEELSSVKQRMRKTTSS